jgi:hypothetical protein
MPGSYVKIQSATVGSSGSASIDFTNIPSDYDDLAIKVSGRGDLSNVATWVVVEFNGVATNRSSILFAGEGSGSPYSASYASDIIFLICGQSNTASTFGNAELYIPNYAGSTNKSISIDQVTENNGTFATLYLFSALWANTAAINRVTLYAADASLNKNRLWLQHSTAVLYGIKK